VPTKTIKGNATVKTQAVHGGHEVLIKVWDMAMPWMCWGAITVVSSGLLAGLHLFRDGGDCLWVGLAVIFVGLVIALADARLRSHRASWEGRLIGPVTALLTGLLTGLWLITGFSIPLAITWLLGGFVACILWDSWMTHGDARDIAATFNAKAAAAGTPGAQMVAVRREEVAGDDLSPGHREPERKRRRSRLKVDERPSRTKVTRAGLVLPSDPAMAADEVAARVAQYEVIGRDAVGSWSITGDPQDGGLAEVVISNPETLTAEPIFWPGPSAPGADLSVPFRLGLLQTGRPFLYHRMPVHHRKTTGKTGSGKTETLCWNTLAEGITREDYAMVASDIGKGEQYLGPVRPALHDLAVTVEEAVLQLTRLHRARLMRCNYLATQHLTEWQPGCGLTFLDCWMEEAAATLRQLGTSRSEQLAGRLMVDDWVEDVAMGRSAGMSWTAGFQRPTKEQAISAVATSQMGFFCFGIGAEEDAKFGLSKLQRERGCRPALFNTPDHRGMFYADTETVPEDQKTVPVRGFYWGPGSSRIAAYASEYRAIDRPWDDVTGEAMTWTPAVSPTSAFPGPAAGAHDNGGARPRKPAPRKASQDEAMRKLAKLVEDWRARNLYGDGFVAADLSPHFTPKRLGLTRTRMYPLMERLCDERPDLVELTEVDPRTRWRIVPLPLEAVPDLEDEEKDA
jgi:hypothetical protein